MKRGLGILMVLMAVVMVVAPIYSDCMSQGRMLTLQNGSKVPMKCHWAGIAEIGPAIPLALAGIYAMRGKRREHDTATGIMGIASGALAILFPTYLIGVCANPDMMCNMVMRPVLISAGTLAIVASAILLFSGRKNVVTAAAAA